MASGGWRVVSGEWRVASGEWGMASGGWKQKSGQWSANAKRGLLPFTFIPFAFHVASGQ